MDTFLGLWCAFVIDLLLVCFIGILVVVYIYTSGVRVDVAAALVILFSLTCPCFHPWTWRP